VITGGAGGALDADVGVPGEAVADPTKVVMLLAGSVYAKEFDDTVIADWDCRLELAEVIHGVTVSNEGALLMLKVCDTLELV
jgi:hypothetical protein